MASGLLDVSGDYLKDLGFGDKLVLITNPDVNHLYGSKLVSSLDKAGFSVSVIEIRAGEDSKTLDTAGRLYHSLNDFHAERSTPILALGGGIIGDLAGFVAATYQRGMPLIQLPTTLVAQVDSSIGGKVAVNHGKLKNSIGTFYQPSLVLSDISTIMTLPPRELSNGLAEIIKSAIVKDSDFFSYLETNLGKIKALENEALMESIFRTTAIKAEVVMEDEMDRGIRNILNFGHTIGHGIETASHFQIAHGEAVAIGMMGAAIVSNRMGLLSSGDLERIQNLLGAAGLSTKMPTNGHEAILQAMLHDKKIIDGKIKFVLPTKIGETFVSDAIEHTLLEDVLKGKL
ncbi:MAG: 3-dehydroquinate synthase [Deltaproteobacteria bacterium]|nr:3-dehydroquinate synthase [Deltaproteobacteria bacterium]